jgi:RimJ/RimL family protein N-acetyltransferase
LNDAPEFLASLGDGPSAKRVTEHLGYGPPSDLSATRALIEAALGTVDRLPYAQRLRQTGDFVGTTSFYDIDPSQRSVSIGHTWIAQRYWRTGVNTESKLIMLSRAFDELGAERVVWHTDIRNLRSQAAIERLGATKEGVLRHHRIRRDGSWRDTVQYSMLTEEWPQAKARLLGWLSSATVKVVRNDSLSRFEGRLGDQLVGVVDFSVREQTIVITHTGTEPAWRGRGIAAQITRHALDDARRRGLRVRPACPYTAQFMAEHPDYADLSV